MATRRAKNATATAGVVDKTPAKKGISEDVEVTPSASAAAAARPRRTCRKTAGVHTRGSGTTVTATTKRTDKKPPRASAAASAAAKRSAAGKRKAGSTSASASSAPSKTPKVATTKSSRRPPPAQPKKPRAKQQNRQDIDIDTALALVDTEVNGKTFAVAHKYDNGRHAAMAKGLEKGSDEKEAAAQAWKRATKNTKLKAQAVGMVFTDLQEKAAAGVLLEDLDPARRTAVDTLGGAAVFGFGTAPAPAAGAGAVVVAPAPGQDNQEFQAGVISTFDRIQQGLDGVMGQIGNSNLIQQQMLGQLDQHRIAIGDLQNGQQQQGAAIGDLQNGQQQQGAVIADLQNGQQQQRAAIAELQDWQQRVIVEGALGGTKANLDNSRFESDPACSAAPPAAIGVHDTASAAQAAPIVHADGSPPSSDKKMPARTGDGALAGGRSVNGAYPSSSPDTFPPSTNRKRSAPPSSLSPPPPPPRHVALSFGSSDAVVGTDTPKNPRAAVNGAMRPSSPSSKVGLFDESMGGYNADASTPPTAMTVTGRTYVRPPSRPPPLKMRLEPEPEVPVQGRFETDFEIIGPPIGIGSFGTVYKCRNNWDRQCYAVKKIAPYGRGQTGRDCMLKEVRALATLCSRDDPAVFYHIVRYCQAWIQEGHLYIQMELCTSTLQAELEVLSPVASACDMELEIPAKRKPMSSGRRYKLLREILLALEFIHKNNMCHLDIKPDNIFIKNDRFKLGVSIDSSRGEGFHLLSLSLYIRQFNPFIYLTSIVYFPKFILKYLFLGFWPR